MKNYTVIFLCINIEVDRLGGQTANSANRPRVLIAKIHNYRVKELIMKLAAQQSLQHTKVSAFISFWTSLLR